jgi:hypothetical protein
MHTVHTSQNEPVTSISPGGVYGVRRSRVVVDDTDVEGKRVISSAKPTVFSEFPHIQYYHIFLPLSIG